MIERTFFRRKDAVDRLKAAEEKVTAEKAYGWEFVLRGIQIARGVMSFAPAADVVEMRHGKWVGTEYDGYADGNPVYDAFECSACGAEYATNDGDLDFNYCPNCGAKMDGGANDGKVD